MLRFRVGVEKLETTNVHTHTALRNVIFDITKIEERENDDFGITLIYG